MSRQGVAVVSSAAQIGREIREHLSAVLRDVMLGAADAVTAATPVDTGNAQNNWILSTGSPHAGVDGSRLSPSSAMQEQGIAKIQRYDVGRDGPIYLRNNVLYVQYLDQGRSSQAPAGFVARAFLSATSQAPFGRKQAARKMLRRMGRAAYLRGI